MSVAQQPRSDSALMQAYHRASDNLGRHYDGKGPYHAEKCCNEPHRRWELILAEMVARGLPTVDARR